MSLVEYAESDSEDEDMLGDTTNSAGLGTAKVKRRRSSQGADVAGVSAAQPSASANDEQALTVDTTILPPRPSGKPAPAIIARVNTLKQQAERMDILEIIKSKKMFRNPSIYEKLIDLMGLNETGSNYPRELYDPDQWTEEDSIATLLENQKALEQKKMAASASRTHIDFTASAVKQPH